MNHPLNECLTATPSGATNFKDLNRPDFVIPTEAYPDFLLRSRRQDRVCGFP
jgi:hypothetical protein